MMIKRKVFYKKYSPDALGDDFDGHTNNIKNATMEELNVWVNEFDVRIINILEKSYIGEYIEDLPFFYRVVVFAEVSG